MRVEEDYKSQVSLGSSCYLSSGGGRVGGLWGSHGSQRGKGGEISRCYQSIKGGEHKKLTANKGDHENNTKP